MKIYNKRDFLEAIKHPYRIGEFFISPDGTILEVKTIIDVEEYLIFFPYLEYRINWEDQNLYASNNEKIHPVYEEEFKWTDENVLMFLKKTYAFGTSDEEKIKLFKNSI
jgi:hypothetical protein